MSILIDKPGFAAQIHTAILSQATLAEEEIDGMRLIQLLAGIITETLLLFDDPDEGLGATQATLMQDLGTAPYEGLLPTDSLPPAYLIDHECEKGRALARKLFEEWLDCAYEFHDLILFVIHNILLRMEEAGQARGETLRLLMECATRALAYEIAAQELCDIVIEEKVCVEGWSLSESVSGLSAVAGRCLALAPEGRGASVQVWQQQLDHVAHVMTQEATRLGIPAGSDWRFGLAANDCMLSAPFELIFSLWPRCRGLFEMLPLPTPMDQAVACAKAAGRMLAVAAGGETPELEPVIAKPLAMAALIDTYRVIRQDESQMAL